MAASQKAYHMGVDALATGIYKTWSMAVNPINGKFENSKKGLKFSINTNAH